MQNRSLQCTLDDVAGPASNPRISPSAARRTQVDITPYRTLLLAPQIPVALQHLRSPLLVDLYSNGGSAFYDGVFLAAKYHQDNGSHEKKALVIVSDGEDNKSKYDLKQVFRAVSESKIIV